MPSDTDLLCGRIAIELGFCTEAQVEQCLEIQAASKSPIPLGRVMVDERVLTEEQHSKVIQVQRGRMLRRDPVANASKEDTLFGTLAVRAGWVTREQLNEGLRLQGKAGERRSLGEILVARGVLKPEQVQALLARQSKRIMSCAECKVSFTVHTITRGKPIACPRCRKPLQEGKPGESVRTDGDLHSDSVLRAREADERLRAAMKPVGPTPCKFCGRPTLSPRGSDGRVECLSCRVRYVL